MGRARRALQLFDYGCQIVSGQCLRLWVGKIRSDALATAPTRRRTWGAMSAGSVPTSAILKHVPVSRRAAYRRIDRRIPDAHRGLGLVPRHSGFDRLGTEMRMAPEDVTAAVGPAGLCPIYIELSTSDKK